MNTTDRGHSASVLSPSPSGAASWQDDPRVVSALEEYLGLLKTGQRPTRQEFLTQHSDIASELAVCLDGLEFVQSAGQRLPASEPYAQPQETFPPTTRLGDYRIIRELGRGGMGIVYEAEQVSLGRHVALKVLPFAASIDPRQRQRFQVEAQAAAHLHHPHIVPIFAVGCDQGVHYYAMQFIEGRSLSAVIRELRMLQEQEASKVAEPAQAREKPMHPATPASSSGVADSDSPTVDLPTATPPPETPSGFPDSGTSYRSRAFVRTVAQLGVQAAEALDHAHGLGVLHRDIKPSNLMVDPRGDLWITDFGLARFQDEDGLTRTGDLVGTLRYMSPEQALAKKVVVDHRTDIYSLGITLYELLTLRAAFDGKDRQELLRQITHDDPTAPRKVNPAIPRDLETIIQKAMEKEPAHRYGSARELADDLQRFLGDKPIQARRPTALEHIAKWARRHKTVVGTATIALLLASVVAVLLVWNEKQKTDAALKLAWQSLEKNKELLNATFRAADALSMRAMQRMAETPNFNQADSHLYKQAQEFYELVASNAESIPDMQLTSARAYNRVGFVRMVTRDPNFEAPYRKSIQIFESEIAKNPKSIEARVGLLDTLDNIVMWKSIMQQLDGAVDAFRRKADILAQLARELPDDTDFATRLSGNRFRLADTLRVMGKGTEAEQVENENRAYFKALAQKPPVAREQAARMHLHSIMEDSLSVSKAETLRHLRLVEILTPNDPELYNLISWTISFTPEARDAEIAEAVKYAHKAVEAQKQNAAFWNTLAVAQLRARDMDAADKSIQTSMGLNKQKDDPGDLYVLAMIRWQQGKKDEARTLYDKAFAQTQVASPPDLVELRVHAMKTLGLDTSHG
jgi:serine/threonine protein kinase